MEGPTAGHPQALLTNPAASRPLPRPNRFRHTPTAAILAEAELWCWDLAQMNADLERDPLSWAFPEETRAFVLAAIEDANEELARREALRDRPEAPGWPARWEDRRAEVERIKAALDLPRFVEEMFPGVVLEKRGKQLACRCVLPGHDKEKTPSFYVDPQKQVWYCHGCKRGGDVFTLAMHYLGTSSFADVIANLAPEAGIAEDRRKGARVG
ncbi:MAG: CHC2 zinc finger domain-containing protein [Chloroflexota bacterium]|nr:CHC2 zinc finger domain-containing protein [Chloroflexota bacterium]